MNVVWTQAAADDRRSISTFLGALNPVAAIQIEMALVLAADSLASFLLRGRRGRVPDTRELVACPPYVIVYEVRSDTVRILRIWHAAQGR